MLSYNSAALNKQKKTQNYVLFLLSEPSAIKYVINILTTSNRTIALFKVLLQINVYSLLIANTKFKHFTLYSIQSVVNSQ